MDPLPRLVAHGGIYGAFAEAVVAFLVGALFVWVWLRERRRSAAGGEAVMRDPDEDDQRETTKPP